MGNIIPQEKLYDADFYIFRRRNYLEMPILATGHIREIHVWGSAGSSMIAQWVFNVKVDGVYLFDPTATAAMKMDNLTFYASKTSLSVAVTRGQMTRLDLMSNGQGRIATPLIWLMLIEES